MQPFAAFRMYIHQVHPRQHTFSSTLMIIARCNPHCSDSSGDHGSPEHLLYYQTSLSSQQQALAAVNNSCCAALVQICQEALTDGVECLAKLVCTLVYCACHQTVLPSSFVNAQQCRNAPEQQGPRCLTWHTHLKARYCNRSKVQLCSHDSFTPNLCGKSI